MTQVLLTSFEPFGGRRVNASDILARAALAGCPGPLARRVHHACLAVDHTRAASRVAELIERLRPSRVVLTGEWSGHAVRLERYARPGPLARWRGGVLCSQPAPNAAPFRSRGLPTVLSGDAGRYVCDTTFWAAAACAPAAVFVHVPRDVTDPATPRGRAIAAALRDLIVGAGGR